MNYEAAEELKKAEEKYLLANNWTKEESSPAYFSEYGCMGSLWWNKKFFYGKSHPITQEMAIKTQKKSDENDRENDSLEAQFYEDAE